MEQIQKYNRDRPEISSLPKIQPVINQLARSIRDGETVSFDRAFHLLTITCNNCHQITKHGFNVIRIPDTQSFPDQDFNNKK